MKHSFLFLFLLAMAVVTATAGDEHISFKTPAAISAKAGDTVMVKIQANIEKGWHTYDVKETLGPEGLGPSPAIVSVRPKSVMKLAGAVKMPFTPVYDSSFSVMTRKVKGKPEITVPVRISPTLKKGTHTGEVVFEVQMCDASTCLPPREYPVKVTVTVTEEFAGTVKHEDTAAVAPAGAASSALSPPSSGSTSSALSPPSSDQDTANEAAKQQGLLYYFFFAMSIGFGALLTPCVFPMIPITVSFFTKRHEKNRGRALADASIYALGIISTFTVIGIIVTLIFGVTGVPDLAANPWLNLAIGSLFILLAFNLFGAFEIQIPIKILNALNKKSQEGGVMAVLLMGLTFSLTSFTCTVPFVSTALTGVSSAAAGAGTEGALYPTVGMLGFATAFALPFFFLAMFPSLLAAMPRAGGWMNNLKVVMGFMEIAAAIKFFSNADLVLNIGILPKEVFLAIWIGCSLLIVLYLLGTFQMKLDSPVEKVSAVRATFAVMFASIAIWLLSGLFGKPLGELDAFLPPPDYRELMSGVSAASTGPALTTSGPAETKKETWISSLDEAMKLSKATGQSIFIDFTGFTCTNCRWMEINMFPRTNIQERMDKMIKVRLYTDRKQEPYISNQNLQKERFGSVALPLYVILDKEGKEVAKTAFTRDMNAFQSFLDRGL